MFNYDPENARENDFPVLPDGEYESEIIEVVRKTSKAGNEMLAVTLNAFGKNGEKVRVFDYIVNPSTLWKLKSICRCLNWEFGEGEIDEQLLVGKRFIVKLRFVKAGQYPAKNEVEHYERALTPAATPAATTAAAPTDDGIPF